MRETFTADVTVTWGSVGGSSWYDFIVDTPAVCTYVKLYNAICDAVRNEAEPVAYMITSIWIDSFRCPGCGMRWYSEGEWECTDDCPIHGTEIGKALRVIRRSVDGFVMPKAQLLEAYATIRDYIYPGE